MKTLILAALLVAPIAHAGGVVLGPPPELQVVVANEEPAQPVSDETIECILAALEAGLDPVEECDL